MKAQIFVVISFFIGIGVAQDAAPPPSASTSAVLADMTGYQLTQQEFEQLIKLLPENVQSQMNDPAKKSQLIRSWMELMVFHAEAQAKGLEQDPALQKRMEFLKKQIVAEEYRKRLVEDVAVSETDTRAFYETNREQFKKPPMINASHILVETEEEAKQIEKSLGEGKDFVELAKVHSKDGNNSEKGGELGWIPKGRLVPEFDNAAFALEPGQVSKPVQTQFGWHIIRVSEKTPEGYLEFDEVKKNVSQQLLAEKQQQVLSKASADLMKQYNVVVR
ncbi:MAG: peptidylprolyl isomerase [Acidobacteria bacterium]|nr:peptidylprolyl isomerase [Acidobacteriota bacterium]